MRVQFIGSVDGETQRAGHLYPMTDTSKRRRKDEQATEDLGMVAGDGHCDRRTAWLPARGGDAGHGIGARLGWSNGFDGERGSGSR